RGYLNHPTRRTSQKENHLMRNISRALAAATALGAVIVSTAACEVPEDNKTTHAEEVVQEQAAAPTKHRAKPKPAVDDRAKPKPVVDQETPDFTTSQENAIASAEDYLSYQAFSRTGLIHQLSSKYGEGFPKADAVFAVNHIDVDWNEQAAKAAKDYLSYQSFSRNGLIHQLESEYGEGFTHAQAVYGVNQTGLVTDKAKPEPVGDQQTSGYTTAQENAIASAEDYLDYQAFSRTGLIHQLSSKYGEGFSKSDAIFAVNHIDVDWNEQAAKAAKDYLNFDSFSRNGLIHQLESEYGEGFTHAQAVYGVNQTGL
ncbi:MAG TPA: Ltp family lipoprotein, partial [Nocardioidaceae bacterium]|nr:Ltp family lipoprotein [Nocardioidaceae bacterium]